MSDQPPNSNSSKPNPSSNRGKPNPQRRARKKIVITDPATNEEWSSEQWKERSQRNNSSSSNSQTESKSEEPNPPKSSQSQAKSTRGSSRSRYNKYRGRKNGNRKPKSQDNKPVTTETKKESKELPATSTSNVQKSGRKGPKKKKQLTTEQTLHITEQLKKGEYECMVCFDRIGKRAGIWNCTNCFAIFHIGCIKKWSNASSEGDSWACPGCRYEFKGKVKATCFCGKMAKPKYDPFLVPHSCGEVCKRKRGGNCPHKCTQICHPGSCPPCPAMGPKKKCFCSKTVYRLRCGEEDEGKSCGQTCGSLLNCTLHRCKDLCHSGECKPCDIELEQDCYCGRTQKFMVCGEGNLINGCTGTFSCENPCEKKLECGNHSCPLPCHPGNCPPCKTGLQITTCPCGSTPLLKLLDSPRTSCTDPLPVCEKTCSKPLECSSHFCKSTCHTGECNPCKGTTIVPCRCGISEQRVACSELITKGNGPPKEILCKTPCNAKRLCGKHRCRTICCPMYQIGSDAHPCILKCDKPLSCGNHKCNKECHRGPCPPCLEASFDELICHCGKTIVYPPIRCGTSIPECPHPCARERNCEHVSQHNCHSDDIPCQKCYALTQKQCGCGRKMMTSKCYVEYPCCGDLCKKPLLCGLHNCNKACHGGPCEDSSAEQEKSCGNPCNAGKLYCDHQCTAPCHPNQNCPQGACDSNVTITCPCGNITEQAKCLRGGSNTAYNNDNYIRLECTDDCAMKLRRRQLAVAFGRAEDGSDIVPNYSIFLTNAAASSPKFVARVEDQLQHLIKSDEANIRFPPMNSFYRNVIHQLTEHYKLESVSYDHEPYRNVVVTKNLRSTIPNVTLTELTSRNPIPRQPGTGDGINKEGKPASLLFYELTPAIKTDDLNIPLRQFKGEYYIKWIDDESAVATFNSEKTMKQALTTLESSSLNFKFSPIQESDLEEIFSAKKSKDEEESSQN